MNKQSVLLSDLERRQEDLAAIEEAARTYRELAGARPDAFTPDLATALNNLADILAALKREPEADAARIEAAELSPDPPMK